MFFLRSTSTSVNHLPKEDTASLTSQARLQQSLLVLVDFADSVNLLDTVGAKLNPGGEEVDSLVLVQWAVHKGGLNDALFTLERLQQALRKPGTSHGHGESGRACTILGLDHLVTTELDAVHQRIKLLASDVGVARLRDQRNDGDTGVATDHGDVLIGRVAALDL